MTEFSAALAALPAAERDAWVDRQLGISDVPADGASLPRGCVPYLPAPIDKLVEIAEHAHVTASDVFVDVGAGIGRAAIAMHLLTGATAIGVEIQPQLVRAARALAARYERVSIVEGDAADTVPAGSVYFLYCPFSDARLAKVLAALEHRAVRVCCLDLPLPDCPWLELSAQPSAGLAIYSSRRNATTSSAS